MFAQTISYVFPLLNIACAVAIGARFRGSPGAIWGILGFGVLAVTSITRKVLTGIEVDTYEYQFVFVLTNLAASGCVFVALMTGHTKRESTSSATSDALLHGGGGRDSISVGEVLFSFRGRISRSEYWLKGFLVLLPIGILNNVLAFGVESNVARMAAMVIGLCSLWPSLAILVKRWHDRDRSAWWLLTLLIPFLGLLFSIWIVIEVWFLKGTEGPNRFGGDPLLPLRKEDKFSALRMDSKTPYGNQIKT